MRKIPIFRKINVLGDKMDAVLKRFWDKVEKTDTCWIWIAHKIKKGYGHFHFQTDDILAHRFSYQLHKGPIPEGKLVLHTCDNPSCVNPDHLWIGNEKENRDDADRKGRGKYFGSKIPKKGIENINCKLTEDQVKEIRNLKETGKSLRNIAKQFNVFWLTIFNIVHRKTWKHI